MVQEGGGGEIARYGVFTNNYSNLINSLCWLSGAGLIVMCRQ